MELLPCPKCESTELHYEEFQSDSRYNPIRIRCSKCLFAEDYWGDTEEECVGQWNLRPIESSLRMENGRMKEVLMKILDFNSFTYEYNYQDHTEEINKIIKENI